MGVHSFKCALPCYIQEQKICNQSQSVFCKHRDTVNKEIYNPACLTVMFREAVSLACAATSHRTPPVSLYKDQWRQCIIRNVRVFIRSAHYSCSILTKIRLCWQIYIKSQILNFTELSSESYHVPHRPRVSNLRPTSCMQPTRLYYAVRGHICNMCTHYKNFTII